MVTQAKRVFFCDVSLNSYLGHCYGYMAPIEAKLKQSGIETHLLGNRCQDYAFHLATGAVRAFTYWCDESNVGQPPGLGEAENADAIRDAHERALLNDLKELDQKYSFTSNDLLIVNTLRHWALRAIPQFVAELQPSQVPRFSIISLFSSEPELGVLSEAPRHYRDAFQAFATSTRADRMRLFSDSDSLIDEYRRLSSLPIHLAPFPQAHPARMHRDEGGPIIVSYLGEARTHKGFHLLPFVAEYVAEQFSEREVRFKIQSQISDPQQPFFQYSIGALSRMKNVDLIPGTLSDAEFEHLLGRSSVLLMAYQRAHYHRQTSAIYHMAGCLGTPVVVSKGTWMARRVRELGGGSMSNPNDYLSVAEAVVQVCRHYSDYAAAAEQASMRWRAFNNIENFLTFMDWPRD